MPLSNFTTRLFRKTFWSLMTRKRVQVLVLLLAMLQLRVDGMSIGGGRCLTCDDYNRLSKEKQCIESYKDCGGCKTGFIQDYTDARLCYEFEIITPPSDVNTQIGDSVRLQCVFSAKVECYWTKNGHQLDIGGQSRYQYAQPTTKEDNGRRDCSLDIRNASDHDTGQWTCGSMATSEFNSIQSKPASISVITTTVDLIKPDLTRLESESDDVIATSTTTGHGHIAVNITQQTQISSFNTSSQIILALLIMLIVITIAFMIVACVVSAYVIRWRL